MNLTSKTNKSTQSKILCSLCLYSFSTFNYGRIVGFVFFLKPLLSSPTNPFTTIPCTFAGVAYKIAKRKGKKCSVFTPAFRPATSRLRICFVQ